MNIINVTNKLNPTQPLIPLDLSKVEYILIHHPEAVTYTWEEINELHKNNGWNCSGYNEYITKDGTVYILRGYNIGAQCAKMNSKSYGICCEGNYEVETEMPKAQYDALIERIRINKPMFPNFKEVAPHSKYYPTECPGKYFPMSQVIKDTTVTKEQLELKLALNKLATYNIVETPEYWVNQAVKGHKASIGFVNLLIRNMAFYFDKKPLAVAFGQAVDTLVRNGVIESPQYWLNAFANNKPCDGEYVAKLIKSMASKLKG